MGQSPQDFISITSNEVIFDKDFDGGQDVLSAADKTSVEYYSSRRWFEGIDPTLNGADGEKNDPSKLKCHHCHVRYELQWHDGMFKLVDGANQDQFQVLIFSFTSGAISVLTFVSDNNSELILGRDKQQSMVSVHGST